MLHDVREPFAVIIMDLEMPLMDGCDATMQIRKIEEKNKYSPTYICGLSAYTDQGKFAGERRHEEEVLELRDE